MMTQKSNRTNQLRYIIILFFSALLFAGCTGTAFQSLSYGELRSIEIAPVTLTLAAGTSSQLQATAIYSNNKKEDVTSAVVWTSDNSFAATVTTSGFLDSISPGSATITATYNSMSVTLLVTVTPAVIVSINITPALPVKAAGLTQQFTATGTFTDATTQNLTATVVWDSSVPGVASISNAAGTEGLATTVSAGNTTISATAGGISGSTTLTVTAATLTSITISPVNPGLAAGMSMQFTATGIYSDSSTQDLTDSVTWGSGTPTVATISDTAGTRGLASGVGAGTSSISATLGAVSGNTTLTVTSATLLSITVTPVNPGISNGTTCQFTATGVYSDSSTLNITSQVVWSSGTAGVATISNTAGTEGLASSVSTGSSVITATFGAVSSSTTLTVTSATLSSITITPAAPVIYGNGMTLQFTATGNYSDSSTQDITSSVTWSSSQTSVATISNAAGSHGLATSVAVGFTTVTAQLGAVSGTRSLEVSDATLVSIAISPVNQSVAMPGTVQFTALGTYNDSSVQDITTLVLWSSDNTGIASISNTAGSKGLATATGAGTAVITATLDAVNNTTNITVTTDTVAPVISSVALIDATKVQVTFSEAVNVTQAGVAGNYRIARTTSGLCTDNSNFTGSTQTTDFSISSVTVVSSSVYTLNLTGVMQNVTYTLLADRTQIVDLATTPNNLACPNNMNFQGIDTVAPAIFSVVSLNVTTVRVTYSENVNSSEARNVASYKIANAPVTGSCSDNTDFTGSTQTADFTITSVTGSGSVYDISLSTSQVAGKTYTLLANKTGIHDIATVPNLLGCPNYSDFTGLEQLKVLSAQSVTLNSFIITFSKAVKAGVDVAGSAEASTVVECAKRYKLSAELGDVTSAHILDGVIAGGAPADPTKVYITHTNNQGGGQYTVIVANNSDGDGFDNTTWGSVRNSDDTENVQATPRDRATFMGSGGTVQDITDGPIVSDPFGDGTLFGFVFKYNNQIYIGPGEFGNSAVRSNADGSGSQNITFSIVKDTVGTNVHRNTLAGPFTSFGYTGCTGNGCGPDLEDGRGLFASGTVLGMEYLFYGGVRSLLDMDYIYYTSDLDTQLDWNYMDLSESTSGHTMGFGSLHVFNNRMYLGFPDDGSKRPYLIVVLNMVQNPVGNVTAACNPAIHDTCNLNLNTMPYIGESGAPYKNPAAFQGIDSMITYNGQLYFANNGGVVRSANNTPLDYLTYPTHWDISPSDSLLVLEPSHYTKSIRLTRGNDILKRELAYPQMAVYRGNLYIIRNGCSSTAKDTAPSCSVADMMPQLWKFDGTNWTRMGQSGNITNMGNANNKYITMVVRNGGTDTTGGTLYIGFDNDTNGAEVWRTTLDNPALAGDWTQVGVSGLGSGATHIYDGVSVTFSGISYIYISAGTPSTAVRVYRSMQ